MRSRDDLGTLCAESAEERYVEHTQWAEYAEISVSSYLHRKERKPCGKFDDFVL